LLGGAEKAYILRFLHFGRCHQEACCGQDEDSGQPGWALEKNSPGKKEQGAVHGVPNVLVGADGHELSRFLDPYGCGIIRPLRVRLPDDAQEMHRMNDQERGSNQKDPRKDLMEGEGIPKPVLRVQKD